MIVGLLSTSFPRSGQDFSGRFVLDLGAEIVSTGHRVKVVAPGDKDIPRQETMNGVEIHRFFYMIPHSQQRLTYGSGIPANLKKSIRAKLQVPLFLIAFLKKALSVCSDCDVIHGHWIASGLIGVVLKHLYGKPLVVTAHGSDIHGMNTKLGRNIVRIALKKADCIITVSEDLNLKLLSWGVDRDKIRVVPNGVNITDFPGCKVDTLRLRLDLSQDRKYVLFVGRLVPVKGVEFLLRAIPEIEQEIKNVSVILIGDGQETAFLRRLSVQLNVSKKVHFLGTQAHTKVAEFMAACDLLVLPSLSEGLPVTILEAMASGIPIVATNVGGIPELIKNGENGILVPPMDVPALSRAIVRLLTMDNARETFGARGREVIDQLGLTWEVAARKTISAYEEVLRRK